MKTQNSYLSLLKTLGVFLSKIATAIVSGMPGEKVFLKPGYKSIFQTKKESYHPESEKHNHRPMAKPTVERQTLLKEKKKVKAVHK